MTPFSPLCNKLDNTDQYLNELLKWVNGKVGFWKSFLGSNLLPKHTSGNVCAVTTEKENLIFNYDTKVKNFKIPLLRVF